MRFFILLSYCGYPFVGWQRQKNGISVQQHLENAFSVILSESILITGAGRTDTGVNALNFTAHFDSCNPILTNNPKILLYKINAILPPEIVVHNICQMHPDAHSRFDAISRTYCYFVHTVKDPFSSRFSYYFPYPLNTSDMNIASSLLLGEKDFTSMAKLHSKTKTNVCNVTDASWQTASIFTIPGIEHQVLNHGSMCFTITANRFLRNMVRAIVGTLLEIGRGRKEPEWVTEVLNSRNRCSAGQSVPAHPLFLKKIDYPYNIT